MQSQLTSQLLPITLPPRGLPSIPAQLSPAATAWQVAGESWNLKGMPGSPATGHSACLEPLGESSARTPPSSHSATSLHTATVLTTVYAWWQTAVRQTDHTSSMPRGSGCTSGRTQGYIRIRGIDWIARLTTHSSAVWLMTHVTSCTRPCMAAEGSGFHCSASLHAGCR